MREIMTIYVETKTDYSREKLNYYNEKFRKELKKVASSVTYTVKQEADRIFEISLNKEISLITLIKIIYKVEEGGFWCKGIMLDDYFYDAKIIIDWLLIN